MKNYTEKQVEEIVKQSIGTFERNVFSMSRHNIDKISDWYEENNETLPYEIKKFFCEAMDGSLSHLRPTAEEMECINADGGF